MKLSKFNNCLFCFYFMIGTTSLSFAQKNIFDIARMGSVEELKEWYAKDKKIINSINESGYSLLILSCYKKNNQIAQSLINYGCDLDTISDMGSALMACAVSGNNEIAFELIKRNCKVDITDNQGTTALMYAVQFGNVKLVKALIDVKADKTKMDNKGKTAFEYAVFSGNREIINLLK